LVNGLYSHGIHKENEKREDNYHRIEQEHDPC